MHLLFLNERLWTVLCCQNWSGRLTSVHFTQPSPLCWREQGQPAHRQWLTISASHSWVDTSGWRSDRHCPCGSCQWPCHCPGWGSNGDAPGNTRSSFAAGTPPHWSPRPGTQRWTCLQTHMLPCDCTSHSYWCTGLTRFNKLPSRTKLQTACEQGSLWLIECSLKIINIQHYKMHWCMMTQECTVWCSA